MKKGDIVDVCRLIRWGSSPRRARVVAVHVSCVEVIFISTGTSGVIALAYLRPVSPLILLAEIAE